MAERSRSRSRERIISLAVMSQLHRLPQQQRVLVQKLRATIDVITDLARLSFFRIFGRRLPPSYVLSVPWPELSGFLCTSQPSTSDGSLKWNQSRDPGQTSGTLERASVDLRDVDANTWRIAIPNVLSLVVNFFFVCFVTTQVCPCRGICGQDKIQLMSWCKKHKSVDAFGPPSRNSNDPMVGPDLKKQPQLSVFSL